MTTGNENEPSDQLDFPIVFREFLYADMDRVRSLFAQLEGGIPEQATTTAGRSQKFNVGTKHMLGYMRDSNTEEYQQRSLLDALFPELEAILEASGWLTDISDIVHDSTLSDASLLTSLVKPGSIIRLTAPSHLFDAEYIARILGGTSLALDGIVYFSGIGGAPATPGSKRTDKKPRLERKPYHETGNLEDLVEEFPSTPLSLGISPEFFRKIIRVAKGMFSSGLHLLMSTDGGVGWAATARLQQGRRYLDAEPDVLFSRYGTQPQEWTVVGTIGHYSSKPDPTATQGMNFMGDDGTTADRTRVVSGLNTLISAVAGQGFADTPKFPGFSIVPLAVYRLIPQAATSPRRNAIGQ